VNGSPPGETESSGEPCWSRTRSFVVFALLLILQVGVVLGLARWPRLASPPVDGGYSSRLEITGGGDLPATSLEADPRQFAGPDVRGFSGAALRVLPPPEYTLAELPGRPRWLGADPHSSRLGSAPPPAPPPTLRPLEALPAAPSGEPGAPLLLPTNTVVYPRGALARRAWRAVAPPQVLPGTEVLNPTTVEVGVSPVGEVVVARVRGSSGNPAADRLALAWAQGVRFDDLTPGAENEVHIGRLTWGDLAVIWRVQPPTP
jgi:hypothetical protein